MLGDGVEWMGNETVVAWSDVNPWYLSVGAEENHDNMAICIRDIMNWAANRDTDERPSQLHEFVPLHVTLRARLA
jgi:gamma-glutamylcysteine synthetase